MINVAFGFMSNMKFAILPSEEKIVERAYRPLFEIFAEFPQLRADLFFSGYSELTLAGQYPDVVKTVKTGLTKGRFRISSNGYEHVALPFVSHESARKIIEKGVEADKRVWGIERPDGFWPSDCAWDPTLGTLLRDAGISWVFDPVGRLRASSPGGIHPAAKDFNELRPINTICTGGVRLPHFFYANNNYNLLRQKDMDAWFAELEQLQVKHAHNVLLSIGLDMETPLVLETQGYAKDGAAQFREFARRLANTAGVRFTLMGDFLRKHPPTQEVYIRQTYWHGYGQGYYLPDGSQKLISLCDAAERDILDCEDMLSAGAGRSKMRDELEIAWEYLMAALVSDAHFTDRWPGTRSNYPLHYPLARVILGALDNALQAHELAQNLKRKLQAMRPDEQP